MAPDIGAGIQVLFFLCLLIAEIVVGLYVLGYASFCFLVTFVNTAAGDDEVQWPDEPMADWILKAWYFLWILAVWAVPAAMILRLFPLPAPVFFASIIAFLWLVFPVSFLSSASASSSWIVFRPVMLRVLLRYGGTMLGFYFLTGLMLALCGGLLYAGVLGSFSAVLLLAAPACAICFFIYGRLLGRVGHRISFYKPGKRERKEQRPEEADKVQIFDPWASPAEEVNKDEAAPRPPRSRKKPSFKKKVKTRKGSRAYDPWAPAEDAGALAETPLENSEPEDPYGPAKGSYALAADDGPLPVAPKAELPDPDLESYGVAPPQVPAPPKVEPYTSPDAEKREMELATRRRPPSPPEHLLTSGVFQFPFYAHCLGPLATLAVGFLAMAFLLRLLIDMYPRGPS
jgi:hypothetical protein